jgi:NitT/TauT family transport system substrate-binding protein
MIIRTLSYWSAAIVATMAVGACSAAAGTGSAASGGPLEQRTITVDSVPAAEEAGLYVAQSQGFFAQQGLTVKINSVTGGKAAIPDLQTGRAQLVAANYVSFILAQTAGSFNSKPIDMRIIAAGSEIQPGTEALYVMPHSKFQTVAELARDHARVGLDAPDDAGDVMVGAALADNGYQLSDVRQVIPRGGFPALLSMLPAGQVDAAWLPQPFGEIAEQQLGATPIADFDQGSLQGFPFAGYIGSEPWVRSHPHTVAAFLKALDEGQQLADVDRGAVEAALENYTGVKPIVAATMPLDSYPLEMDVPQLQRVADAIYQFGLTPRAKAPFQVSSMMETGAIFVNR